MIRLEPISGKNVWDILKLHVSKEQENFVAPNDASIIEAYIGDRSAPVKIWSDSNKIYETLSFDVIER